MPATFVLPRQVVLPDGAVAPGAVASFYRTGTDTPQSVYTDAALSNATTSITADSAGTLPKVYLNPSAASDYRVKILTASGSQIYQEDDISRLPLTQADIGGVLYPQTTSELEAGVTIVNYFYPAGYVDRYGTNVSPGSTDMTTALTAAFASSNRVVFSGERYKISGEIACFSDLEVEGNGSIITAITRFRSYLNFDGASNIRIRNLSFDCAKTTLATYADYPAFYNVAIYLDACSDVSIQDCEFTNLYTAGIYLYQCTGSLTLERNRHTSPTQSQNLQMQHVHIQTCNFRAVIRDCSFVNAEPASPAVVPCGIFASGTLGSILIDGNYFNWCGRDNTGAHRLGVIDFYGDSENVTITNNVALNTMAEFSRLSSIRNLEVANNIIEMADGAEAARQIISVESTTVFVGTGQVGIQQASLHHNKFTDEYDANRIGIALSSYDYSVPLTDVSVHHNTFVGMQYAVYSGGVFSGLAIHHNRMRGENGNTIRVNVAPGGVTVTDTNGVAENASACEMLAVEDNNSVDESLSSNFVLVDFTKSPAYSGFVTNLAVRRNSARSVTNAGAAIIVAGSSSTEVERVQINDNDVDGYNYALSVSECREVSIEGNKSRNLGTDFLLSTNNARVVRHNNKLTNDALQGRATLVAGTVTVSTAEVVASESILLTRVVAGGTLGHLSVGTIVAGTSFVINSSDASDTSTVFWEIVH